MSEQPQQCGSSQSNVASQLGYFPRSKPRQQETDYYGNKGIVIPYETYQKTIGPQLTLNEQLRTNKDYQKSADGLRITIPIKRQRATKYFTQNPIKEQRKEKLFKQWKEEDKPADGYRHLIKHYLSPFLKERGYTIAQIYSVKGEVGYGRELLRHGRCYITSDILEINIGCEDYDSNYQDKISALRCGYLIKIVYDI
ncbi:MAG: hypothetical protein EZS28_017417 [Streblomastix strix]|uniref:Uncharacterized protein n=1 Tax=Streblomastix strix TaxID=222440 RepID=A0A5J4VWE8_9EUKA|nr:MAG: hypothetical protein EZS28_017417 [Streblomastix strix]